MARINQAGRMGIPDVLLRFAAVVGRGAVRGPRHEVGRQDLYYWEAWTAEDVRAVGVLIGPWLSPEKREEFSRAVGLTFDAEPRASAAWAAGFYDAEGSTSLSNHRSHAGHKRMEASITQGSHLSMPQELVRFNRILGLGEVYGPYAQAGANKLVYRWRLQKVDEIRRVLHLLLPWLGDTKRAQALRAIAVVDGQPPLPRGRVEWGSHKTHCIHGHEYATARIRPYVCRGGTERRDSKQCLACTRDQARARRLAQTKIGDPAAADHDVSEDGTTC